MKPLIGAIDLPMLFPRPRLRLAGEVITTAIIEVIGDSPAVDGTHGRSISCRPAIEGGPRHPRDLRKSISDDRGEESVVAARSGIPCTRFPSKHPDAEMVLRQFFWP